MSHYSNREVQCDSAVCTYSAFTKTLQAGEKN
uniref:Uncharacterized protein n=1 Tax=Anguilla anguilla TaxID=7936 RepID=A0A0E9VXS6_ANGAN